MVGINTRVWEIIERDIAVKKLLLDGLINVSALARKISKEENMGRNIDAVISAIRRYEGRFDKKAKSKNVYHLLKKAKIATKTKLTSVLIKRSDRTEKKMGRIYSELDLGRGSVLRIFEVSNYIKIITDEELLSGLKKIFPSGEIQDLDTRIGEITINYTEDITKIPGVFAGLSNELALNDISIIDSMICQREHIIIVREADLEKAFNVIFSLTSSKR